MSKRKKYSPHKKAKNMLIGARFGWDCENPLEPKSEITNTWLGHRSSVKEVMIKRDQRNFYGLTNKLKLKWKVNIEVEFRDPNGKQYFRGADLVIHGILSEADGHYQQAIEEIFSVAKMSHYVTCHMTAEVIGTDVIRETDFKEEAA